MSRRIAAEGMFTLLLLSMLVLVFDSQPTESIVRSDWTWYKTELHHHSTFSDGFYDRGVVTQHAKDLGYNAFFLTDHDFGRLGTDKTFDDSLDWWEYLYSVDTTWHERVNEGVTAPVPKGTSLHLRSNSSGSSCQRYATWYGPMLYRGSVFLNFSLYPETLSNPEFAGAYVELVFSLKSGWENYDWNLCEGGVTWVNGTTTMPHHVILRFGVLGSEGNITEADETIRGFNFTVDLGAWNAFNLLNVTDYMVESLSTMLAPDCAISQVSLNCVTDNSEVSDVYFDDVALYTAEPVKSVGELFAYRNEELASFDTDTFKTFPGVELSEFLHFNHFVYNFTAPEDYYHTTQIASTNSDVVNFVHAQGYPVQINHPFQGPSGYTGPDIVENSAYGADLIEARTQNEISIWDQLLNKGVCIMGVWSTDSHGFILQGDKSTMVCSPELTLEKLLENMLEGRMFLAVNNFTGKLSFNTEPSTEPYPARHTKYIAEGDEATFYLKATDLTNGWKVCWVRNGTYFLNDTITSATYEVSKSFSMPDEADYWRVEIRDASDNILAMSEPIFFKVSSIEWKTVEDDHFVVYYPEDQDEAEAEAALAVASNVREITLKKYPHTVGAKVEVYLYPDRNTLLAEQGCETARAVVGAVGGTIYILGPWWTGDWGGYETRGDPFRRVLNHEYVHVPFWNDMSSNGYDDQPSWFAQGIAEYISRNYLQCYEQEVRDSVQAGSFTPDADSYCWGLYILEYMYITYGQEKVINLVRSGEPSFAEALSAELGVNAIDFENGWKAYLFETFVSTDPRSTDLNGDNKVNILDIAIAALAFGSYPSHARWNPMADINKDDVVDLPDIMFVVVRFGKKP